MGLSPPPRAQGPQGPKPKGPNRPNWGPKFVTPIRGPNLGLKFGPKFGAPIWAQLWAPFQRGKRSIERISLRGSPGTSLALRVRPGPASREAHPACPRLFLTKIRWFCRKKWCGTESIQERSGTIKIDPGIIWDHSWVSRTFPDCSLDRLWNFQIC